MMVALRIFALALLSFVAVASDSPFKPVTAPGIDNMFAIGANLYSGSVPENDEAFAALARLGVKTIVTVDGARPDVEAAHRHGLRYVHLPHGYDGIDAKTQAQIVKAAEISEGAVFVHCHHGMHRGPAAVAVVCMAREGWSKEQAHAWLVTAGTATNYAGLYDVVRNFEKPTAEQLNAITSLPEVAKVSGLVEAMVGVDDRWDTLKAVRAAGYKAPKESPDIVAANEAVILWEHFREAQRLQEAVKIAEGLKRAEAEVKETEELLRAFAAAPSAELRAKLDRNFEAVGKSCASCHKANRD